MHVTSFRKLFQSVHCVFQDREKKISVSDLHHKGHYRRPSTMSIPRQSLGKLQDYARKVDEAEYNTGLENGETAYEVRLNRTVQHLQDQVKQHKDTLEKVCRPMQILFDRSLSRG